MNVFFAYNKIGINEDSAHNHLAALCASYSHNIRYVDDSVYGKIYGYAEGGYTTLLCDMPKATSRTAIIYDDSEYDLSAFRYKIIFGPSGKYATFPVDYDFKRMDRLDQIVSFGYITSQESLSEYENAIMKTHKGKSVIVANMGTFVPKLKEHLLNNGVKCIIPPNSSMVMLDAYMRTSKTLIHFGNKYYGELHAKASLFAIEDSAEYITNKEIIRPTDIHDFIKTEGI